MNLQRMEGFRISDLLIKNKMTRYALCKKVYIQEQASKHIIDERNNDIKLSTNSILINGFDMLLEDFFADDLFKKNHRNRLTVLHFLIKKVSFL